MNELRTDSGAGEAAKLALDCFVEGCAPERRGTELASLAPQLVFDLLENSARFFASAFERDFRRRQQLRLIVVQVARNSRAFLVDSGEHPERELADQSAATGRLLLHHPVGHEWTEPRDNCFGIGARHNSGIAARRQRHRATIEWDAYKRKRIRIANRIGEIGARDDCRAAEAFL